MYFVVRYNYLFICYVFACIVGYWEETQGPLFCRECKKYYSASLTNTTPDRREEEKGRGTDRRREEDNIWRSFCSQKLSSPALKPL